MCELGPLEVLLNLLYYWVIAKIRIKKEYEEYVTKTTGKSG